MALTGSTATTRDPISLLLARIFFATVLGAVAGPAHAGASQVLGASTAPDADSCAPFETETEFVEFDLWLQLQERSVPLRFPAKFVDNPRSYRTGERRTTSYIQVDIDTFEPISRYQDHLRHKAGIYYTMGVLFSDRVSLDDQARIDANLGSRQRLELDDYDEESAEFGLKRLVYQSSRDQTFLTRGEAGQITDVFWCSAPGSVPSPGCTHIFKFKRINVNASYRRTFMDDWRNIRNRIERFLACAMNVSQ